MSNRITKRMLQLKIARVNAWLNGSEDYRGPGAIIYEGAGGELPWAAVARICDDGHNTNYIIRPGSTRETYEKLYVWADGIVFARQLADKKGEPK